MSDCLFCKIVHHEIAGTIVYEDNDVVAFLDIHPNNPGHTLVIPKEHSENMLTISDESLQKVVSVLPKIVRAIMSATHAEGVNINNNSGAAAGQVVMHTHFHIIPRVTTDGYKFWPHREYKPGEAEVVAEAIRHALK